VCVCVCVFVRVCVRVCSTYTQIPPHKHVVREAEWRSNRNLNSMGAET